MTYPDSSDLAAAGLAVSQDGPVLTVTLDRPQVRNAQTPRMWRALAAVGDAVAPEVRVVVLRGNGDSFSAGLDRAMLDPDGIEGERSFPDMAALDDSGLDAAIDEIQSAFTWWRRPDFVSVAAVQGHAVGAGFQLALACDLRVLADDAQLCMRETALGLVPDLAGTKPLVDAVGYSRALEICATSRWVGAHEAHQLGIATAVVPRPQLEATVGDLVAGLTTPLHDSVSAVKGLLVDAESRSYDDQRAAERRAQAGRLRAMVAMMGGGSAS